LKGVPCSFVVLDGTGGTNDGYVCEIPAGGKTKPQKHMYEEMVYVSKGYGATTVWQRDGKKKHTFEWGPGSMFAIPINADYQHFNASGSETARYFAVTNSCFMMNLFHNSDYIFNSDYVFTDRFDPRTEGYFNGEGTITGRFQHRKEDGAAPAPAASAAAARTPPRVPTPRPASPPAKVSNSSATWAIGLAAAVTLVGGVGYGLMTREAPAAVEPPLALAAIPSPPPLAAAPPSAPSVVPAIPGADPALARKVAETLARYGRALESVDARLLAEARPDLGPHERRAILVRFEGSTNVATDLRVQNVVRRGAEATVSLVRTDVIAGRPEPTPPVAETLRFKREGGAWVLRPAR